MTISNIVGIVIGAGAVFYFANKRRQKQAAEKESAAKE
jgi:hypothetical protein